MVLEKTISETEANWTNQSGTQMEQEILYYYSVIPLKFLTYGKRNNEKLLTSEGL